VDEVGFAEIEELLANPGEHLIQNGYTFTNAHRGEGSKDANFYFDLCKVSEGNEWRVSFVISLSLNRYEIRGVHFGKLEGKGEGTIEQFRYWFKRAIAREIECKFGREESNCYWSTVNA